MRVVELAKDAFFREQRACPSPWQLLRYRRTCLALDLKKGGFNENTNQSIVLFLGGIFYNIVTAVKLVQLRYVFGYQTTN